MTKIALSSNEAHLIELSSFMPDIMIEESQNVINQRTHGTRGKNLPIFTFPKIFLYPKSTQQKLLSALEMPESPAKNATIDRILLETKPVDDRILRFFRENALARAAAVELKYAKTEDDKNAHKDALRKLYHIYNQYC